MYSSGRTGLSVSRLAIGFELRRGRGRSRAGLRARRQLHVLGPAPPRGLRRGRAKHRPQRTARAWRSPSRLLALRAADEGLRRERAPSPRRRSRRSPQRRLVERRAPEAHPRRRAGLAGQGPRATLRFPPTTARASSSSLADPAYGGMSATAPRTPAPSRRSSPTSARRAPACWPSPRPAGARCSPRISCRRKSARPPPPTANRFVLFNPDVSVSLTGPKDGAELDQALAALDRGPMDAEEIAWMRRSAWWCVATPGGAPG